MTANNWSVDNIATTTAVSHPNKLYHKREQRREKIVTKAVALCHFQLTLLYPTGYAFTMVEGQKFFDQSKQLLDLFDIKQPEALIQNQSEMFGCFSKENENTMR